ncbi:MAG: SpoIIE family protein phosphatase [bacterium]|nr:SpoIIE family protein phosphatase [bacterium]
MELAAGTSATQPERVDPTLRAERSSPRDGRNLELLHEVSREVASILDREQLLQRVAELIKQLIDYQLFSVMLWDEDEQRLESVLSVRWNGCTSNKFSVDSARGLIGAAAALRRPIRVADVRQDPRYVNCGDDAVRSELTLPMLIKDRLIGVLDFESYQRDAFCADNERLLMTLASNIAVALENAALYERVKDDERRLAADLETAREMQRFLLPRTTPWLPGLQTAVAYAPARHLGGDLFDFLPYGEGRTAIAVGDVAGKGTSAALYGSLAIGLLRGYMSDNRCDPSCVLGYLNEELRLLQAEKRFLALTFAIYDRGPSTLTVANSGLPYPLLVRAGEVREIEISGLPLGSMAATDYRHIEIELEAGDVVVFASDGIEECLDPDGEPFGEERVRRALLDLRHGSAQEVADGLLAATDGHMCGKCEASDDRTVVVLRVGDAAGVAGP